MVDRSKWRNVLCPDDEPDAEMQRIDAMEQALGEVPPEVMRVRALISRFDSLVHYRTFDNVALLLDAIGRKTYPGSPAVDVLSRAWEIDEERRERVKGYARALAAWAEGRPRSAAAAAGSAVAAQCDDVYEALGEPDDEKRWLAASLGKTLKVHACTPQEQIDDAGAKEFVCAVYQAALGRTPSPDDLDFRVAELAAGKTREGLMDEVFGSDESRRRRLHEVAAHLKDRCPE